MNARTLTPEDVHALESLIDRTSIGAVLESLSTIADAKAEHIGANWQDAGLARVWTRVAGRIISVVDCRWVREVSR